MAQIPVRLNTQEMSFPLLSQQSGRTVISGEGDLTYVPGVSTDGDVPQDRGIPGIYYCHNVMPSTYGWQSIGYAEEVASAGTTFVDVQLVQGATISDGAPQASSLRTYIGKRVVGSNATLWHINPSTGVWQQISNTPTFPAARNVTVAQIRGFSYIMIERLNIYVFNVSTNALVSRNLAGLTESNLEGVLSASGYLIVWTARRVLWSSTVDPEDFVPDEITGAGGGGVQEAAGAIVSCKTTALGFIVYTDTNAVSVVYSGNDNFPFNFKAIPSVGGIYNVKLVSEETANGYHYAFTTNGIQRITHNQSATILPNVTDFIDGNLFEDFNESTNVLSQTIIGSNMNRRLALVANRYIIVSYAASASGSYTHAIIVDLAQGRMGKLKFTHRKVFEWRNLNPGTFLDSRGSIAMLAPDGSIHLVNFDLAQNDGQGVMLLGKLQLARQRMMELHRVEIENVRPGISFGLSTILSYDGKTAGPTVAGYNNSGSDAFARDFLFSAVATNHTLLFKGTFNILTIIAHISLHGRA
jgi:hypothetical protein